MRLIVRCIGWFAMHIMVNAWNVLRWVNDTTDRIDGVPVRPRRKIRVADI
jgi:hypothetical protein